MRQKETKKPSERQTDRQRKKKGSDRETKRMTEREHGTKRQKE